MLKEFVEKKHYKFAESAKDWRDAIRMSCEVLEADGTVEEITKKTSSSVSRNTVRTL